MQMLKTNLAGRSVILAVRMNPEGEILIVALLVNVARRGRAADGRTSVQLRKFPTPREMWTA
jgi:hypothetical protein